MQTTSRICMRVLIVHRLVLCSERLQTNHIDALGLLGVFGIYSAGVRIDGAWRCNHNSAWVVELLFEANVLHGVALRPRLVR
jgi:hypothetical protein